MTPSARLEELNARFSRQGKIEFETGPGGIVVVRLESGSASARVSLLGATVISYIPEGGQEVLFLSRRSGFQPGKAIRGGIPLCLPWFGDNPADASLPKHGFFRLFDWEVASTSLEADGSRVLLTLADSEATRGYWPHTFRTECGIALGDRLTVSVKVINAGTEAFALSCAFHPYFAISNIGKIELPGLAGKEYVDRLMFPGDESKKVQADAQRFEGEVDRIYAHGEPVDIVDPAAGRKIRVAGIGTAQTVVWNPWKDKCRTIADLEAGDYLRFVCAEPGIIAPPEILVEPGATFAVGMSIEAIPSYGT
jgi:glucose-6-phosphate 1-epimerase